MQKILQNLKIQNTRENNHRLIRNLSNLKFSILFDRLKWKSQLLVVNQHYTKDNNKKTRLVKKDHLLMNLSLYRQENIQSNNLLNLLPLIIKKIDHYKITRKLQKFFQTDKILKIKRNIRLKLEDHLNWIKGHHQ
jgi:hypothetical protein